MKIDVNYIPTEYHYKMEKIDKKIELETTKKELVEAFDTFEEFCKYLEDLKLKLKVKWMMGEYAELKSPYIINVGGRSVPF